MSRGGPRQGTPGKAYAERTDMAQNYGPQTGTTTAAAGGIRPAQGPPAAAPTGSPVPNPVSPDEVLPLDAPTQRPDEPVTAGLPFGPGAGPPPTPNRDILTMLKYLPLLAHEASKPGTPQSVVNFVSYLQSQVPTR